MLMVQRTTTDPWRKVHGLVHRDRVSGSTCVTDLDGESDHMVNVNRLCVMPTDSHITEERRIEEAMIELDDSISTSLENLHAYLGIHDWVNSARMARQVASYSSEIWIMDQRLQDVKQINEQYERIQAHIDRIEATAEQSRSR